MRVTATLGNDGLISNDDRPTSASEQEAAEGFEIFLAVHKSGGAVISLGTRECASVCGDEAALPLRGGYVERKSDCAFRFCLIFHENF